jgi:hypothetical protein
MNEEEDLDNQNLNYFNNDYLFLIIQILLEKYHTGEKDDYGISSAFTLDDFIKGDLSKCEEITGEIEDTNDYSSPNEYVLSHIIRMGDDLNILKLRQIGAFKMSVMLEQVVEYAIDNNKTFPLEAGYYCAVIDEIMELQIMEKERNENLVKTKEYTSEKFREPIFFDDNYSKHIALLLDIVPEYIYLRATFIDDEVKTIEKEIQTFLKDFSNDLLKDYQPDYSLTSRLYFTKQIENFYAYLNTLPLIGNTINIPFTVLSNRDFEVVKILKFLELNKKIRINKWSEDTFWKVDFINTPITIENLINNTKSPKQSKQKISIKFNDGTLYFEDKQFNFDKKQIQKDLLNTLFKKPKYNWSNDEIWEDWGEQDFKKKTLKFYTASDEINKMIALETGIRDFLIKGTKQIKINPKYVS